MIIHVRASTKKRVLMAKQWGRGEEWWGAVGRHMGGVGTMHREKSLSDQDFSKLPVPTALE